MKSMYDKMVRLLVSGALNDKEAFIEKMSAHIERTSSLHSLSAEELCDVLFQESESSPSEYRESMDRLRQSIDTLSSRIDELICLLNTKK